MFRRNLKRTNSTRLAQVTVDQRALIDKMLARYSGEFTVFRELLQNSDDARSSVVEIRFTSDVHLDQKDTGASTLFDSQSTNVTHWTVRNNGEPFKQDDWKRITTIAMGNTDSRAIGAFGVGFYSVFSVTDKPSITSEASKVNFEWDSDNQLCFRQHTVPKGGVLGPGTDCWKTTIELPLRKAFSMPPILDLMRFLASSITFMVHLTNVCVFLDNHPMGSVEKTSVKSQSIGLPQGIEELDNKEISMDIDEIQHHRITIKAKVMHAGEETTGKVDLSIFSAKVKVVMKPEPSDELVRCMKKTPPPELEYSLIYTGQEHNQSSGSCSHDDQLLECASVFHGLRADLSGAKRARVFIGQATAQTTGVGGHMASRFIPTVERELIDFSGTNVAVNQWNSELLHVGGMLCRAVYEWELSNIQQLWEKGCGDNDDSPSLELRNQLNQRFLHVLRFFTFHDSTPAPEVARLLADSFYGCTPSPLTLLSSVGVRAAPDIRKFDPALAFLKSLPMLSEYIAQNGGVAIASLPDAHKIRAVQPSDVQRSLQKYALNEEGLVSCLRWWIRILQGKDPIWTGANLLHFVTLICSGSERKLPLSSVQYFLDPKGLGAYIPPDGPLPESLLPLTIYQHFTYPELATVRSWREFSVTDWLQYLTGPSVVSKREYDFTQTIPWTERVLETLSLVWPSLKSEEVRRDSKEILKTKPCIPTTQGLHQPDCSYLLAANENPFDNLKLATVQLSSRSLYNQEMETLLASIGVRRNVPPEILRDRIKEGWGGSVYELIRYLIKEKIPQNEVDELKTFSLFTKREPTRHAGKRPCYRAEDLYPPEAIFCQLQLPVINWDEGLPWSNESAEAQFLYDLGLRRCPPLNVIVELCSSPNTSGIAFRYFYRNLGSYYSGYNPSDFRSIEFIPARNDSNVTCCKMLDDVCSDTRWCELGFFVVDVDVSPTDREDIPFSQVGIHEHPSPTMLLSRLRPRPQDEKTASLWFDYLADCISDFTKDHLRELSGMQIVPTRSLGILEWVSPAHCYLAEPKDEFTRNLFVFVGFGENANRFLSACGSKDEPSVRDIVDSLIDDPTRFYELAGGPQGFLAKLRELATEISRTAKLNDTLEKMLGKPVLLGVRRKSEDQGRATDVYELRKPEEIVIIDDTKDEELFSEVIWAVPQEDLEPFYVSIGCRKLSKVIEEEYEYSTEIDDLEISRKVKDLVLGRLPIFLKRYNNTQPKIPFDSFCDKFSVRVCDKLRIFKTFTIGENMTKIQEVWAAARHDERTGTGLWISRSAQDNMYDLSVSLCQILFGTFKHQDAFALAAMLSDSKLLENAGYVRQAPGQQMSGGDSTTSDCTTPQDGTSQPASSRLEARVFPHNPGDPVKCSPFSRSESTSMAKNSTWDPSQIIPQKFIRDTVKLAIDASNSGTGRLPNRAGVNQHARFCGDQRSVGILCSRGDVKGVEVHAAEGVPEFDTLLEVKHDPLDRFASIIIPIAGIFELHTKSLHIFYDVPGGPIAFNRRGAVYLNLRFFEEWHDENVKKSDRERAHSFWFLAIAHEIAHNIVTEHNSDHEFWFSVICEKHVAALSKIQRSETSQVEANQDEVSLFDLIRFVCGFEVGE